MSNNKKISTDNKRQQLSHEIIGILGASAAVSLFFFLFLNTTANSIVLSYFEAKNMISSDILQETIDLWIRGVSFTASLIIFTVLFLFLLGQKLSYLRSIIKGIDALRTHRMNFTIPLEGNNEFTELAQSINSLSETERQLKEKESRLIEERESFIRALSHDIRTPLTSILSYSQFMSEKDSFTSAETHTYIELMQKKSEQIKDLTDRLLDGTRRNMEEVQNGRLLMQQLAEEWLEELEDDFQCKVDYTLCPDFTGTFDIGELQRIFDNISSNIIKYADEEKSVSLKLYGFEHYLVIEQTNAIKPVSGQIESNKIGLQSIRQIASHYDGRMETDVTETWFSIKVFISIDSVDTHV